MKKNLLHTATVLLALLPAAYLALVWDAVPQTVALHFDANFRPDRTGDKTELWLPVGLLALVSIAVYFLFLNLHRFDPKRRGTAPQPVFQKLGTGLVVFMAALGFLIIGSAKDAAAFQGYLFPLLGLLFAFIGNNLINIKPNYFAGLRLPWTLNSDENWRRTHRLGGKLWFAGGLLIASVGLFLPPAMALLFFLGAVLVMVLVPVVYSYRLFKKGF